MMKDSAIRAKELNITLMPWDSLDITREYVDRKKRWGDAVALVRYGRIDAKLGFVYVDDEGTIQFPEFRIEVYRPRRRRRWWRR
jgi:hypothetical protein